jgi:ubiquinone/menaquinone biosynthesis C-methylase UbiE
MPYRVDYDGVADAYDQRYTTNRYDGVLAALHRFIGNSNLVDAVEVGCGTGHWLVEIRDRVRRTVGLDLSMNMLRRARAAAPGAHLVRGRAEQLPWTAASVDRVFCINALHHFQDADAFLAEARRVLRPGGALLTIGLDPHAGLDSWFVYDYFPSTLAADQGRFLPTAEIRQQLTAHGFVDATTEVTQHLPIDMAFDEGMERGLLDRTSKSQLLILSEAEYRAGLERLNAERPRLRADLRLYATTAVLPAA